jgi:hypothetical protein
MLWKKYISWEKTNPTRTEDPTLLCRRVMFAYEQCLLCLGHHPDIWYEAALYLETTAKQLAEKGVSTAQVNPLTVWTCSGSVLNVILKLCNQDSNAAKTFNDEAATMYERATMGALSKNFLLYFAYADFEESRMKYEKVHTVYQKILDIEDVDPTLVCNSNQTRWFPIYVTSAVVPSILEILWLRRLLVAKLKLSLTPTPAVGPPHKIEIITLGPNSVVVTLFFSLIPRVSLEVN